MRCNRPVRSMDRRWRHRLLWPVNTLKVSRQPADVIQSGLTLEVRESFFRKQRGERLLDSSHSQTTGLKM